MDQPSGLEKLQALVSAHDVAALFGLSYSALSVLLYKRPEGYRYRIFEIKKKTGGTRQIASPTKRLKAIQRALAECLQAGYSPKPCAHGFIENRGIVSNAQQHLGKRFIFNVDIEGFFDSIHFGRVRNLLMAGPFSIPQTPATILAQIVSRHVVYES